MSHAVGVVRRIGRDRLGVPAHSWTTASVYDPGMMPNRPSGSKLRTIVPGGSDEELVARMARKDADAATELFRRLSPLVYGLLHRITGVPEDAEEVLVDSFHQAWSQARLYDRERATVTGWLLNIARSRALDARARRQHGGSRPGVTRLYARRERAGPLPRRRRPRHRLGCAGA